MLEKIQWLWHFSKNIWEKNTSGLLLNTVKGLCQALAHVSDCRAGHYQFFEIAGHFKYKSHVIGSKHTTLPPQNKRKRSPDTISIQSINHQLKTCVMNWKAEEYSMIPLSLCCNLVKCQRTKLNTLIYCNMIFFPPQICLVQSSLRILYILCLQLYSCNNIFILSCGSIFSWLVLNY